MQVKLLELRDEGTFIPLLCVDMNPGFAPEGFVDAEIGAAARDGYEARRYLLRRCGYACDGRPNIAITKVDASGDRCSNDPYYWGDRTRAVAHDYIIRNWDTLKDGDVVDVEFILGEKPAPKVSERMSAPL